MTTDIARIVDNAAPNAIAVLGSTNAALERLGQWVSAASQANQLVAPLVDTAFVPDAYRPKVDPRATAEEKQAARGIAVANATAAVLQGITLGLDPLTALQQIYIVHGRPGMYSEMKVAMLKGHGHEVWTEDISDSRAVVCGRRKGTDYVERVTITMDQARKAGWTSNQAYSKTPQDMLYARAAGRVCDRIAPDVLMGIASVEEIQDSIQAEATVGKGTRTVSPPKRAAAQAIASAAEPPLDDAVDAEAEPAGDPPITAPQMKKLHVLLGKNGYADRAEGLAYLSGEIGRDITTSKDLTKVEAMRVIDALEAAEKRPVDAELEPDWPEAAQPPAADDNEPEEPEL
jgi:hypothetical protein